MLYFQIGRNLYRKVPLNPLSNYTPCLMKALSVFCPHGPLPICTMPFSLNYHITMLDTENVRKPC